MHDKLLGLVINSQIIPSCNIGGSLNVQRKKPEFCCTVTMGLFVLYKRKPFNTQCGKSFSLWGCFQAQCLTT